MRATLDHVSSRQGRREAPPGATSISPKTKSVRPTEARARCRSCALRGHGCTWLAVLKHGGIIGACFKTLLKLRACTPRPEKWHRAE